MKKLAFLLLLISCSNNKHEFKSGLYLHEVWIDREKESDFTEHLDGYVIDDTLYIEKETFIDGLPTLCVQDTYYYRMQIFKVPLNKSSDSARIRNKIIECISQEKVDLDYQNVKYYRVLDDYIEIIQCQSKEFPCVEINQWIDRFYFP